MARLPARRSGAAVRSLLRAVALPGDMRRNPDDPFDDLFRQLERFMDDVMGGGGFTVPGGPDGPDPAGADTHVDVHEYDDHVTVIADLPGAGKDDIDLACDGTVLTIRAESEHRRYDERVELPAAVDEESARAKYNNGVLEVRFERADGGSASIDIE